MYDLDGTALALMLAWPGETCKIRFLHDIYIPGVPQPKTEDLGDVQQ